MSDKAVFIDSNIWLYALIEGDDPRHKMAKEKIRQAGSLVVSSQVISEVCVNMLKKAGQDEAFIRALVSSFYANYRVVSLDENVFLKASDLRNRYSLSYWDSMIVAAALEASCSVLYSEDMQSGLLVDQSLRIINPLS
jgi:predicted nucleic acid-binding protein